MSVPAHAERWLTLEENLILRAGAGTGKTHALITLALGLLGGLRRGQQLEPSALWLLTFTEEAAGELRTRLRERLAPLAAGAVIAEREPELWAAAERAGVRLPAASGWREVLERVGDVHASTLHGACGALLRELGGPGLSEFVQLDEETSGELIAAAAQEAVLAADPLVIGDLLEDLGYRSRGDFALGLIDLLGEVHRRISDDGWQAPALTDGVPPALAEPIEACRAAFAAVQEPSASIARAVALLTEAGSLAAGATAQALLEARFGELTDAHDSLGRRRKGGAAEAKAALESLTVNLGLRRAAAHGAPFLGLLAEVARRYELQKRQRGALDFADLCSRARDLLRDDGAARREAKARVGALLLDETQDTSQVQVELCLLLAERRGHEVTLAAEPVLGQLGRGPGRLSLEPGVFCAVGDRKQSIYEFRGANVAVFEALAAGVIAQGGTGEVLGVSRRSRPALVELVNAFFGRAMADGGPGGPGFGAEDCLTAHRPAADLPPAALLALSAPADGAKELVDDLRRREANAVAARVAALLRHPPPALAAAVGGELRPGDVALLSRTTGAVALFRSALAQVGLPSVFLKGDGFWQSAEVLDAAALLAAVIDPRDGLAALTLLRSPLCGVLDVTVGRLALAEGAPRLSLSRLWRGALPTSIAGDERERLLAFGAVLRGLRQASSGLGAAGVLTAAEAKLGLRARYADAQASANLDKLAGKIESWQAAGCTVAAVARRLKRLTEAAPREPLAPAVDGSDRDAVRLLTVHAAKGLQFPVVFVVDCGRSPPQESAAALYTRGLGLSLKGRDPLGHWQTPAGYASAAQEVKRRQAAESRRLLYVAATRAQELLFFSGEIGKPSEITWRTLLEAHGAAAGLSREEVSGAPNAAPAGPLFGERPRPAPAPLEALVETAPLPRLAPDRLPLAARAAADLGLCPRRYQLRQLWQLPQGMAGRAQRGGDLSEAELERSEDPRALGTQAHRLLELVNLSDAARDLEAALATAAASVSREPLDAALLAEVRAALGSAFGQRLSQLPAAQVKREVPFVLRLGAAPTLVISGSIDLLVVDEDAVWVVDYKRGPRVKTASYDAQVRLYALAAQALLGREVAVKAGLWFLASAARGPEVRALDPAELEGERQRLVAAARHIAGRDAREALWPGLPAPRCRAMPCAYVTRCHGPSRT